jgi:hypothetical protein
MPNCLPCGKLYVTCCCTHSYSFLPHAGDLHQLRDACIWTFFNYHLISRFSPNWSEISYPRESQTWVKKYLMTINNDMNLRMRNMFILSPNSMSSRTCSGLTTISSLKPATKIPRCGQWTQNKGNYIVVIHPSSMYRFTFNLMQLALKVHYGAWKRISL